MKTLLNQVAIFLLVGIWASSCTLTEKLEDKNFEADGWNAVKLNEAFGFLQIESASAFQEVYLILSESHEEVSFYHGDLEGFTSQMTAYASIDTDEEYLQVANDLNGHPYLNFLYVDIDQTTREMSAERVVPSPTFARLVNKDGLLQIEHVLYKYTQHQIIKVENPSSEQIKELIDWHGGALPSYAVLHQELDSRDHAQSLSRAVNDVCTNQYRIGGSNPWYRIRGQLEKFQSTNRGFYFEDWYVTTTHQRRRFQIWFGNNDADLEASYFNTFTIGNTGGTPQTVNVSKVQPSAEYCFEKIIGCSAEEGTGSPCETDGFVWLGQTFNTGGTHKATQGATTKICETDPN
ncbi:MAG: hypothetical protein AAFU33_16890 [Bacteroidota bacterium]